LLSDLITSTRIKAWLAVNRNQTRDYLDLAAVADSLGIARAGEVLRGSDDYYADINARSEPVATQVARQLADPRPRDAEVLAQLNACKALAPRWQDWNEVKSVLARVAEEMTR
jgi:hypothetical protein